MTISTLTSLLTDKRKINIDATKALTSVVEKYPYFQAASTLYLKGLKNSNSFKYNIALKNTAAITTDRSILFDFITSEKFNQNQKTYTDEEVWKHIQATQSILEPDLFQPKEKAQNISIPLKDLVANKPLTFNKEEKYEFTEWLQLTSFKPIKRTSEKAKTITNQQKRFRLIDTFIANNPKITPKEDPKSTENLAKQQISKHELMTETLAKVYLAQKKYKKAIQAYTILRLKYPEKSSLFANQIKAIQTLQQNN